MLTNLRDKKISIYTLGCKVNQYESDCMADALIKEGCILSDFESAADIYIINTCAVTNMAEKKSRQIIHRARKINPDALIIACGCYVQAQKDALSKDEKIDILVGNNRKKDICRIISEYIDNNTSEDTFIDINKTSEYENMTLIKPNEHTRAYVKVQDGCNNFCSYCLIPYTRGRIRSRALNSVVSEVEGLANNEIKEIVLTGINLSAYMDGDNDLLALINAVSEIDGIKRIRFGSLEPRIITDEFLKSISSNEKVCPHFHLSLQSACNNTLKRMNRRYTIEEYMEKCDLIRKYYDRPAITTDVIVGFPGETDEDFETTYNNLIKLNLYEMHIFKYSKRNGTVACSMPNQVSEQTKNTRSDILLDLAARNKNAFEASFKGEKLKILVEEILENNGEYTIKGHTDRYVMINEKSSDCASLKLVNSMYEVNM